MEIMVFTIFEFESYLKRKLQYYIMKYVMLDDGSLTPKLEVTGLQHSQHFLG